MTQYMMQADDSISLTLREIEVAQSLTAHLVKN
jgi:hypothetical protein